MNAQGKAAIVAEIAAVAAAIAARKAAETATRDAGIAYLDKSRLTLRVTADEAIQIDGLKTLPVIFSRAEWSRLMAFALPQGAPNNLILDFIAANPVEVKTTVKPVSNVKPGGLRTSGMTTVMPLAPPPQDEADLMAEIRLAESQLAALKARASEIKSIRAKR